jgi:hypothetical protein
MRAPLMTIVAFSDSSVSNAASLRSVVPGKDGDWGIRPGPVLLAVLAYF